ncbi:MAG: HAMP domain-containing protein [Chloroflexi bacterium]|nr:HAMP domain-containing protein [Chloroflexota bacterium]
MFHRLQTRLFLTLISVAVIALAIVVMVAMQQTRRQFGAYVARDQMITLNQTAQLFEAPILSGSLTELDSLTAEVSQAYGITAYVYNTAGVIVATSDLPQVGQRVTAVPLPPVGLALKQDAPNGAASTVHFFPAPGNNQLVEAKIHMISSADIVSSRQWLAPDLSFTDQSFLVSGETSFPSITPSRDVAYTTVSLPDVLVDTSASQNAFIQLVNRAFVVALGVSLLVAVLLSWVTARRILRPVQTLTTATRQMGQGDLSVRVAVQGKDELAELGQSFNQMAADLAHQAELRRHLAADVAHELLTPLTAVRGHLEAVQDGLLEPTPDVINSLHDEVMLLDKLIADLQELSLAEAGQLHLDMQPVSLVDVVMGAVTAVTPQLVARHLTLTTDLPDNLPLIELDTRRMGQVFRNLLGNAIKYSDPGGQLTITAWQSGDELLVSVRDTGAGIAPEHLPYVFDRFYRADPSRARDTGGSGLGLAIVKGVVEAHHGRVWAESQPGIGSIFTVSLPI